MYPLNSEIALIHYDISLDCLLHRRIFSPRGTVLDLGNITGFDRSIDDSSGSACTAFPFPVAAVVWFWRRRLGCKEPLAGVVRNNAFISTELNERRVRFEIPGIPVVQDVAEEPAPGEFRDTRLERLAADRAEARLGPVGVRQMAVNVGFPGVQGAELGASVESKKTAVHPVPREVYCDRSSCDGAVCVQIPKGVRREVVHLVVVLRAGQIRDALRGCAIARQARR